MSVEQIPLFGKNFQAINLGNMGNGQPFYALGTVLLNADGSVPSAASPALVAPPFTRSSEVTGTFTPSGSYAANTVIGPTGGGNGVIQIPTGLAQGTPFRLTLKLNIVAASIVANGNITAAFFTATPPVNPVEGAQPVYTAADAALLQNAIAMAPSSSANNYLQQWTGAPVGELIAGASGNIFMVLAPASTETWTTPGVATWRIKLLY